MRVAVLGGGISGLSAAWKLSLGSHSREVLLFESTGRLGGWMRSEKTENGSIFEIGPRSIRTAGISAKTVLELISTLGLESEMITVNRSHKAAGRRLIYTNKNGLLEIPSGPSWLFRKKLPFTSPLLATVLREPFRARSQLEDESIYSFFSRRLSKEVADYVVDPFCRGVYAGSAHALSIRSCFSSLHGYERNHGSLIKGMLMSKNAHESNNALVRRAKDEKWMLFTFRGGLETLAIALGDALTKNGVKVHMNAPCTGVKFTGNGAQVFAGGSVHNVDRVVSTLRSDVLADVLEDQSEMSKHLRDIPHVTAGVVNLEYSGDVLPSEYSQAFGYLVPSHQASKILGVVFDSSVFPEHSREDMNTSTRLTVMLGGYWFEDIFGQEFEESEVTNAALSAVEEQLRIRKNPVHCSTMVLKKCIPQYILGHHSVLDAVHGCISERNLPITLLGSSYNGVSVNDCIHNSVSLNF